MTPLFSFYFINNVKNLFAIRSRKTSSGQRRGVSPVIATTIILAITISLGLALWGFANSGVGSATVQYSQAVEDYGDVIRNHRYVIANIDFDAANDKMSFWIYNNGKIDTSLQGSYIFVTCGDGCTQPVIDVDSLCQYDPANPGAGCVTNADGVYTVTPKTLNKFSVDMSPVDSDETYEVTMVSDAGLTQTYVKRSD